MLIAWSSLIGCDASTGIEPNPLYAPGGLESPLSSLYDAEPAHVQWLPVDNATAYEIERTHTRKERTITLRDTVTETSFTFPADLGQYTWRVRAFRGELVSQWSQSDQFTRDQIDAEVTVLWTVDGVELKPHTRYFLSPATLASVAGRFEELGVPFQDAYSPKAVELELSMIEPEGTLLNQFSDYRIYEPGLGGSAAFTLLEPPPAMTSPLQVVNPLLSTSVLGAGTTYDLQIQTLDVAPPPATYVFNMRGRVRSSVRY